MAPGIDLVRDPWLTGADWWVPFKKQGKKKEPISE